MGEKIHSLKGCLVFRKELKKRTITPMRFWLIQSVKELVHPKVHKCNVVAKA